VMFLNLDEIGVSKGFLLFEWNLSFSASYLMSCLLVGTPVKRTRIIQVRRLKAAVQLDTMHTIVQNKSPNPNIITFVWLDHHPLVPDRLGASCEAKVPEDADAVR
jgi:hypothetical protein